MTVHDCHEATPGYSPAQVLHDECAECLFRSKHPWEAIGHLDPASFRDAWARAVMLGRGGLTDASVAEMPVLQVLNAVAVQLERVGIPFGAFPGDALVAAFAAGGLEVVSAP